jgi:uncharacterized membrane protein
MGNSLRKFALCLMTVLAIAVALYSLRFLGAFVGQLPRMDPGIAHVVTEFPVRALMHMVIAPVALLVGALQFLPRLRERHRAWHRRLGQIYVAACVIAGIAALFTAPHASGGPVAGFGFALLAVLWIGTTLMAWRAAVRRDFARHRLLMRLSYAMTFGAVTLRLQIPLFIMAGFSGYPAASVWLAYTSWIPNVIAVLLFSAWQSRRSFAGAPLGVS